MTRTIILALTGILLATSQVAAQIVFNGELDLELNVARPAPSFVSNNISHQASRPHLTLHKLNLYGHAPLGYEFNVETCLQLDSWGTGSLNPPRLTRAVIIWQPKWKHYSFSAGRFTNPFGLYPKRVFKSETSFITPPLVYSYFVNISDRRGFSPSLGSTGTFGKDDVGMTTIYFAGYSTGGLITWTWIPDRLEAQLALVNGAPSSQEDYTRSWTAGLIGHVDLRVFSHWRQGFSASWGGFMQSDSVNKDQLGGIQSSYRNFQALIGTDFTIDLSRAELSGEIIVGLWRVPMYDQVWRKLFDGVPDSTVRSDPTTFTLREISAYVDLKIDPFMFERGYGAVRFDYLNFTGVTYPTPYSQDLYDWEWVSTSWDNDVIRVSGLAGYRWTEAVSLKASAYGQLVRNDSSFNTYFAVRSMITVFF